VGILLAEDDSVLRRLLAANLTKWGYDVVIACDGREAWQALHAENAPRLAILDWMMPGMDGIEVCRKIWNEGEELYTYMILLTALDRDEDLVTGMDAGADDYITKPFKSNELQVRLRAGRRIVNLQNDLIAARETLREKATRDSLTGLWNHEEIRRILEHELDRGERKCHSVGVILIDLDHFKRINDTYGHLTGDAVLGMLARRMLANIRSYDAIGRYGGEEFLAVLPGCDTNCATASAERLRLCIGKEAMDTAEGLIPVTVSLGVAANDIGMRRDANSIFRAADLALYRAKEQGRNRVEVASNDTL
jgi:diguanylate cyclase (GGDEF)-like protein